MTPRPFLPLDVVELYVPLAAEWGVSTVARSPRGFLRQYQDAAGRPERLSDYWVRRRQGFIERHLAQVVLRGEPLFADGVPTRRHLALIMWAFSPRASRL